VVHGQFFAYVVISADHALGLEQCIEANLLGGDYNPRRFLLWPVAFCDNLILGEEIKSARALGLDIRPLMTIIFPRNNSGKS
jgi:hypothetical protein